DKTYTTKDTYEVFISYIAKPYERKTGTGTAVTSDRGLFFVNHDGKDKDVPQQIWTQGETTNNSCWFPTFDHPIEKSTQEIAMTVEDRFITISNGRKTKSETHPDGTRTDYWQQDLPHSIYLFAMVVGEFGEYKDKWRGKDVNYYLEKKYAPYAKQIFGNTPEMLEFYSQKLGIDYVWDKYAQVVVREFVSGAMENTGCTVFFDAMNEDDRQLLDEDHEDIIAHELFHHWFGDYVTCETYGQIALNESFATYSEYLWIEHKYGKDAAAQHLKADLESYLGESGYKKVPIIRYRYAKDDDMFDGHSYQKGGCVLHTLRNYVGDEAFFLALHNYLTQHAFQNTEIHDLRMAFEAVIGEDLNWFFNQWFLTAGHPEIEYDYHTSDTKIKLSISQLQKNTPPFRLFFKVQVIDIMGQSTFFPIEINSTDSIYELPFLGKMGTLTLDSEGILLGTLSKKGTISPQEVALQYKHAANFRTRYAATEAASTVLTNEETVNTLFLALKDPFWEIRNIALQALTEYDGTRRKQFLMQAIALTKDEKAAVRAAAVAVFQSKETLNYADNKDLGQAIDSLIINALSDKSYNVSQTALEVAAIRNDSLARSSARRFMQSQNASDRLAALKVFENYTDKEAVDNVMSILSNEPNDIDRSFLTRFYIGTYIMKLKNEGLTQALNTLMQMGIKDSVPEVRLGVAEILKDYKNLPEVKIFIAQQAVNETNNVIKLRYEELSKK
ncbi:MAG: M1 family aminopeptidase, partial [Bacteroidales bacterium]